VCDHRDVRYPLRLIVAAGFMALAVALSAVAAGGGSHLGHAGPSAHPTTDLTELWAVPPVEVAAILIAVALYWAGVRRAPGLVSVWRRVAFAGGIAILLVAVSSPLGGVAQQGLLAAHMLQHTLIGAVAPLLLLLGMPRAFVEPLVSPGWRRRLERVLHPAVAFPLWVVGTIVWLLPPVHAAVLESSALWIVQQASFLLLGLILWAPVLETLPGPEWFSTGWKCGYMLGVWVVGLSIANVYWFSGTAFYDSHAAAAAAWDVQPLEDQANAGTVMMVLHCLLAFGAIAILFFRQAREGELRQRLIEAGIDPARVERATRAGTAAALARAHGVPVRTRAGID
jgi:cytochrome c oxidase assembly factor CtaG